MEHWTFEFLKKRHPHVYPAEKRFWFPLYIQRDVCPKIAPHSHEFAELALVLQGEADHNRFLPGGAGHQKNTISQGDIFGFLPGEYHEFNNGKDDWCLLDILFDPAVFGDNWNKLICMPGLDKLLKQREILHLSPNCFENISTAAIHLQHEIFHQEENYEMNLEGLLLDLLLRIGRSPIQTENLKTNVYTDKAIQYIRHHFAEKITLDDIARYAGAGKTYLCYLFQDKMGISLWGFLNQVRIERAKFYIQTMSNVQISEVAAMCGFENNSYFAKVFKKYGGISPREYLGKIRSASENGI